jgi:hypothetical protein
MLPSLALGMRPWAKATAGSRRRNQKRILTLEARKKQEE